MMNDKELNPREPENALTGEEESALRDLLRSAYPAPPSGITERIMERIREEIREEDRKILPAPRKKNRRGTWIRWSALAASILLVGTIGLSVLPRLTQNLKTADSSMADSATATADGMWEMAAEPEEAFEEAFDEAAPELPDGMLFAMETPAPEPAPEPAAEEKSAATAGLGFGSSAPASEEPAASNGRFTAPAAPAPDPNSYACAEAEEASELRADAGDAAPVPEAEAFFDFNTDSADAADEGLLSMKLYTLNGAAGISTEEGEIPMMTSGVRNSDYDASDARDMLTYYYVRTACAHAGAFRNSYHDIPEVLIAKVGPELYGAWATKVQNEDLCGVNILSFAVRFGLSAEEILATGDTWYFLDLPDGIPLTEENAGAVEQYYLDGGDPGKMIPRVTVYNLKTAMIREAGMDAYLGWRGDGNKSLVSWSVAEGASALGLSAETMDRLCGEALEKTAADYGPAFLPDRETVLNG